MNTVKQKIGFIGGGNMATSLIGGIIDNGSASARQLWVSEPNKMQADHLVDTFGISTATDNQDLVKQVDVVVIAVKPQILQSVLEPIAETVNANHPLIISIVAGIPGASIEQWLGGAHAVVRVMPNTPALVGAGASGLYANRRVSETQRETAEQLLNAVGCSTWVASEADIDSITALSGSGPAYFMLFIKSLTDAAIDAGLDPDTAKLMAVQTAAGAAQLISASDESLQTLIDNVTSPGGTTEQALNSLHESDLTGIVTKAFNAAKRRSEELAAEFG